MRKLLTIIISLGLMALTYQLIVNIFISHKDTTYSLLSGDRSFLIEEKFYKMDGSHYYEYVVKDEKDNKFSFYKKYNFNKQSKVLKDIVTYQDKNVLCYLPIYKDDSTSELNCFIGKGKNKELVDYNYLVNSEYDNDSIVKYYEHLNYSRDSWNKSKDTKKKYDINNNSIAYVYTDNVPDGYVFPIWNYSGLFLIKKSECKKNQYLDKDIYDNKYSVMVGKYYFIFDFTDENDTINDLYYVNVEDGGKASLMLPSSLSSKMVVNGIFKNKLYITDLSSKSQFRIDPFMEKIENVGNSDEGFYKIKNGKLVKSDRLEASKDETNYNEVKNVDISNKYDAISIKKSGNIYYFRTKNNDFYRVNDSSIDSAVKLFHFDKVSDWESKYHGVMVVSGDTMYFYDENIGIRPILQNKELIYNFKNICNFYKES